MAEQGSGRRRWTCKGKGNLPIITQSMQWAKCTVGSSQERKLSLITIFAEKTSTVWLLVLPKDAPKFCFANT